MAVVTVVSHYVAVPFTRGFFCSDTTIKYPYRDNTIPTYAAVILSIALPVVWVRHSRLPPCSIASSLVLFDVDVGDGILQTVLLQMVSKAMVSHSSANLSRQVDHHSAVRPKLVHADWYVNDRNSSSRNRLFALLCSGLRLRVSDDVGLDGNRQELRRTIAAALFGGLPSELRLLHCNVRFNIPQLSGHWHRLHVYEYGF